MIRREVHFPGSEPQWLLFSQVEHARLSGALARAAIRGFSSQAETPPTPELLRARDEVIRAIEQHDEGWAEWEAWPSLDADGKPPSFLEMPLGQSLAIWSQCIEHARHLGPLAASMVAGHFQTLLSKASDADRPEAVAWREQAAADRKNLIAQWNGQNPGTQGSRIPEEALNWLQELDVLSLLLCIRGPIVGEVPPENPQPGKLSEVTPMTFDFTPTDKTELLTDGMKTSVVEVQDWAFGSEPLLLGVPCDLVPQRSYRDTRQLLLAREPRTVWLTLTPAATS